MAAEAVQIGFWGEELADRWAVVQVDGVGLGLHVSELLAVSK